MSKGIDFLSPKWVVLGYICLYTIVPFTYYIFEPKWLPSNYQLLSLYSLLPLFSYILVMLIILMTHTSKSIVITDKIQNVKLVRFLIISFGIFFIAYNLFWYYNNSHGYYSHAQILSNIMKYRINVDRGAGLFFFVKIVASLLFILPAVMLQFLIAWNMRISNVNKIWFIVWIIFFIPPIYYAIFSGARFYFISVVIASLLGVISFNKAKGKKGIRLSSIVIYILGSGIFVSLYSFIRQSREIPQSYELLIYEFVRRFDAIYPNFYYLFNSSDLGWRYGITYVYSILNVVPRSLFPEKPLTLQGELNDKLRLWSDSGMDFGAFGELWINFGPFALIFCVLFYYFLYKVLVFFYKKKEKLSISWYVLYYYVSSNFLFFVSSPINSTNMIIFVFSSFVVFFLARLVALITLRLPRWAL